ncbi:unnamed protein product, partial [Phaeothamnion confervicola]
MQAVGLLTGPALANLRNAFKPLICDSKPISSAAFLVEASRVLLANDAPAAYRSPVGRKRLAEDIARLFDLIDVDGEGSVPWEAISDFCVAVGGGRTRADGTWPVPAENAAIVEESVGGGGGGGNSGGGNGSGG